MYNNSNRELYFNFGTFKEHFNRTIVRSQSHAWDPKFRSNLQGSKTITTSYVNCFLSHFFIWSFPADLGPHEQLTGCEMRKDKKLKSQVVCHSPLYAKYIRHYLSIHNKFDIKINLVLY